MRSFLAQFDKQTNNIYQWKHNLLHGVKNEKPKWHHLFWIIRLLMNLRPLWTVQNLEQKVQSHVALGCTSATLRWLISSVAELFHIRMESNQIKPKAAKKKRRRKIETNIRSSVKIMKYDFGHKLPFVHFAQKCPFSHSPKLNNSEGHSAQQMEVYI